MEKKLLQYLQRKTYMNFPIYETNENEIISIKGDASYFYQITTPDLSQLTDIETESLYDTIESEMRNFKEEYFYKIYYLSDKLYLNTNDGYKMLLDSIHEIDFNPTWNTSMLIREYYKYDDKGNVIVLTNYTPCEGCAVSTHKIESEFDLEDLYNRWKIYPGQVAHNGPNLRKQVLMLVYLYSTSSLRAAELFNRCSVGGVTGARYVSTLKKFELIRYNGARKKGHYEITQKGMEFIENSLAENSQTTVTENSGQILNPNFGVAYNNEEKELQSANSDNSDL